MDNEKEGLVDETSEGRNQETNDEIIKISKKQYLSELDKARTDAAKSREFNIKKQNEMTLQELQRKIEDLEYQNKKKDLILETKNRLQEMDAVDLLPLYDFDFNDINGRIEFAKKLQEVIQWKTEKEIKQKISTPAAPKNVKQSSGVFKNNMTPEEAKEFLKNK
jgi:hypothetical protein